MIEPKKKKKGNCKDKSWNEEMFSLGTQVVRNRTTTRTEIKILQTILQPFYFLAPLSGSLLHLSLSYPVPFLFQHLHNVLYDFTSASKGNYPLYAQFYLQLFLFQSLQIERKAIESEAKNTRTKRRN